MRAAAQMPMSATGLAVIPTPVVSVVDGSEGGTLLCGGLLRLSLRGTETRNLTIWSRSEGVTFFELTPLAGIVGANDARQRLGLAPPPPVAIGRTPPPADPNAAARDALFLRAGVDASSALTRYQKERDLIATLATRTPIVPALLAILDAPPAASPNASWRAAIEAVDARRLRQMQLQIDLAPGAPQLIGYVIERNAAATGSVTHDILFAFDREMPEQVMVSSTVTPGSDWRGRMLAGFQSTLGALGGAAVGYLGFWLQQRYSRRQDEKRAFANRKVEKAKELRGFFTQGGNYETLRDFPKQGEEVRARNILNAMTDEGLYSLLPGEEATALNQLADPHRGQSNRIDRFDQRMHALFGEFMG